VSAARAARRLNSSRPSHLTFAIWPGMGREGESGVSVRTSICALVIAASVVVSAAAPPVLLEPLTGRQVFPTTNWWNQDVSGAPLDARSAELINWIGGSSRQVHPDF